MAGKRIGNNITLGVDETGGSTFVTIADVINIDGYEQTKDDVDVSLLADAEKSYLPGQKEPGELKFSLLLDPNSSTNTLLETLYARDATGVIPAWRITYPSVVGSTAAVNKDFTGYVKTLGHTFAKNELIAREVTVKRTGVST